MVVLGDLFHAKAGRIASHTLAELRRWRSLAAPVEILLVRGNHDRHAGDPPSDLRINCVNAPAFVPPFVFRHEPVPRAMPMGWPATFTPASLSSAADCSETLPCFLIGQTGALIPAFGSFTGLGDDLRRSPGERVFVVAEGEVLAVG